MHPSKIATTENNVQNFLLHSPRLKYKIGLFKNKGALLVLLWSFSSLYVFQKLLNDDTVGSNISAFKKSEYTSVQFITATSLALYPFFGWLADVCFGRYKVIKYSLCAMWAISSLFCLAFVVITGLERAAIIEDARRFHNVVGLVLILPLTVALGGFHANAIQFGMDQLVDAPSYDIASFIRLYGWVWFFSRFLSEMSHNCFCHHYEGIDTLIIPGLLTVALCLDFICSGWLLHEPVFKNSLLLIYQVLKYAVKNKYPHKRSTFSLWDKKQYSRVDLAKTTFGGPFTVQQVEDVKSFWRIVLIMSIASLYGSLVIYMNEAGKKLGFHLNSYCPDDYGCKQGCFWEVFVEGFGPLFISVFIPLFEISLACFKRCHKVPMLKRILVGMLFVLSAVIIYGTLETAGHFENTSKVYNNTTCVLDLITCHPNTELSLNFAWLLFPNALYTLGTYILLVTAIEFLCAQAPSSMRGLQFGLLYGINGVSIVINAGWLQPLKIASKRWSSGTHVSCGTIYLFVLAGVLLAAVLCFYCASKCYKKRERSEDQEIFAVDYS